MSLGAFFGHQWLWVETFAGFGFAFEHFDVLMAIEVHWFGFGRLGCLCRLWGGGGGRRQALASGTGSEDMYILDFAPPQLGGVGTGGTYLQVNFLNPSRKREKKKRFQNVFVWFFIEAILARSSSVNARQLDGSDFNSEIYLHPSCQPPLDIVFIQF